LIIIAIYACELNASPLPTPGISDSISAAINKKKTEEYFHTIDLDHCIDTALELLRANKDIEIVAKPYISPDRKMAFIPFLKQKPKEEWRFLILLKGTEQQALWVDNLSYSSFTLFMKHLYGLLIYFLP